MRPDFFKKPHLLHTRRRWSANTYLILVQITKDIYEIFSKFTANKERVFLLINGLTMDNYSISSFPNQNTEKSCLIELKGELSIKYIDDIKAQTDQIIKDFDTIEIHVSDANIIDLSMLQYLISLKKSKKTTSKTVTISFEIDTDLRELLEHAGFKNIENLKG